MKTIKEISAYVISHIGNVRQNHEDNFLSGDLVYISQPQQKNVNQNTIKYLMHKYHQTTVKEIFALADGMGGHQAGEVASLTAVSKLSEARDYILSGNSLEEVVNRYHDYLMRTNATIVRKSSKDHSLSGMGATLSTLIIYDGQAIGINLGDSRIYQYQQNQLTQLTKDHTEGQRMLDLKLLTAGEIERFKSRKELTRYLGMGDEYLVVKGEPTDMIEITDRTWFLLCSDGLTDIVTDQEIQSILNQRFHQENVETAVKELVEKALQGSNGKRGGTDNITVMIVEIRPVTNQIEVNYEQEVRF